MNETAVRASVLFNGVYTIQNINTKEHRTFKIETQSAEATFAPGKRILSVLAGPDNTSDYRAFAFVDDEGIHVWEKCRRREFPDKMTVYEHFAGMIWDLGALGGKHLGSKYELLVQGHCLVCNRKLTTPDSIREGVGPVCRAKAGKQ